MTNITCNHDFNGLQSLVMWDASAGTTYQSWGSLPWLAAIHLGGRRSLPPLRH